MKIPEELDPDNYKCQYAPPRKSILVYCLHCNRKYQSRGMRFENGMWLCKYLDCNGAGFGFDIHGKGMNEYEKILFSL